MKTKMLMYQDSISEWYNGEFKECVRNINLYRTVAMKLGTVAKVDLEIRDL
ncbi:hypothetical protein [Methanofollis sp. UBA420]|jgi:hypothetical protein|uniref:hypothetical protein n=1 Tax=Methanofollis sp. UBA420 TaxID=1915514 RepID=UPI00316AC875